MDDTDILSGQEDVDMLTEEQLLQEDFLRAQKTTPMPIIYTRIVLPKSFGIRQSYNIFECTNEHADAKLLFRCLAVVLHDVQTHSNNYSSTKLRFISLGILSFVPWLNEHRIDNSNRAKVVKDFETFRVNECRVKPQSSNALAILNTLKVCLGLKSFQSTLSQSEIAYIRTIVNKTKLSKEAEPQQITLTNYFGQMQWLREYMDNDLFNRVASPKALMNSFSITVAALMLEAQQLLNELELYCLENKITTGMLSIERTIKDDSSHQRALLRHLINIFCENFSSETPDCIKVLLFDLSNSSAYEDNLKRLKNGMRVVKQPIKSDIVTVTNTAKALFNYDIIMAIVERAEQKTRKVTPITPIPVTELEQICFMWLMAWQAVQPSDIPKLLRSDFRFMERNDGSVTHISCEYYKSRAHNYKEIPLLATSDIEGKAILNYISRKTLNSDADGTLLSIPNLYKQKVCGPFTFISNIFKLAAFSIIHTKILHQLGKRDTTSVFLDCINAMTSHGITKSLWNKSNLKDNPCGSFLAQAGTPLSLSWFGLAAVKNSSIHSRSDKYRVGHLVNYNSHENEIERDRYMTAENQEWLNNCGRVTRSVMNDLAINVLSPSSDLVFNGDFTQALEVINDKKNDVLSRLKLVTETTGKVNELGMVKGHESDGGAYPDTLYLLDTPETYVQMQHYVTEAKRSYKQLLMSNPVFLEYTVLPTCEWIEVILNASNLKIPNEKGFSQKTVKAGDVMYKTYQAHLLPLFTAQLT
ncbi:hypothetical protein [Pseudoalteromonas sp. 5-MNA-CIBAN-0065]|uniref:hypothetical protein n=2 Tax=Pseudoalteromonas TaxID=53246 RepID=UPI00331BDF89